MDNSYHADVRTCDSALRAAIELAAASGSQVTGEQLARAQDIPAASGLPGPRPGSPWPTFIRAVDGQFLSARGEPPENVTYPGAAEPLRRAWIAPRAFGPAVLETVTLADIVSGELWLPILR